MWKKLDLGSSYPYFLSERDNVMYMHDYLPSVVSFKENPVRSKIVNLKKPPERRDYPEWRYKEEAIQEMAHDIANLIKCRTVYVVAMPTSKNREDPQYDDRLEKVGNEVASLCPNVSAIQLFDRSCSISPIHLGSGQRNPNAIAETLVLQEENLVGDRGIVLIDDVIASGATFVACCQKIRGSLPSAQIAGVFWARVVSEVA